jgi:hypothetical protein
MFIVMRKAPLAIHCSGHTFMEESIFGKSLYTRREILKPAVPLLAVGFRILDELGLVFTNY